jgi:threonine dehydrogenase-like Zn-dependent dehydrogenase
VQAVVLTDYGRLEHRELPRPRGEGVLVQVGACGICGSDLSVYKGTPAMRARWKPPLILGHELAGTVLEGPADWVGKQVTVNPLVTCGVCAACKAGQANLCPQRTNVGFHYPGGLAGEIWLPAQQLLEIDPRVPVWQAALTEPLAVAVRAARLAGSLLGQRALVLGGGAIGSLVAWVLGQGGARVSLLEPNALRRPYLEGLGLASEVVEQAEPYFDLVIDTVGAESTLEQAVQLIRPGGKVVLVGLMAMQAGLPLQRAVLQEISVQGSYMFTPAEFALAARWVAQLPEAMMQCRSLSQAQQAFDDLLAGRVAQIKTVLLHL